MREKQGKGGPQLHLTGKLKLGLTVEGIQDQTCSCNIAPLTDAKPFNTDITKVR
jgi:hypothetical protein